MWTENTSRLDPENRSSEKKGAEKADAPAPYQANISPERIYEKAKAHQANIYEKAKAHTRRLKRVKRISYEEAKAHHTNIIREYISEYLLYQKAETHQANIRGDSHVRI